MMSENKIRALIVLRLQAMCGSCNSYHIGHVEGQIKALLFVLTGRVHYFKASPDVYDAAGIKYRIEGEYTVIDDDEEARLGLKNDESGRMSLIDDEQFGNW